MAISDHAFDYLFHRRYGRWTSNGGPSRHHVRQLDAYREAAIRDRESILAGGLIRIAKIRIAVSFAIALLSSVLLILLAR